MLNCPFTEMASSTCTINTGAVTHLQSLWILEQRLQEFPASLLKYKAHVDSVFSVETDLCMST